MARNDPQVNFRIPTDLKVRLEAEALANNRTLTAELVARLQAPSLADAMKERLEWSMFKANYTLAQFGVKMLKFAAGMVIRDAPDDFRNGTAYKLLLAASEAARVPPDLPASLSQQVDVPSEVDVERAISGLRVAAAVLGAETEIK